MSSTACWVAGPGPRRTVPDDTDGEDAPIASSVVQPADAWPAVDAEPGPKLVDAGRSQTRWSRSPVRARWRARPPELQLRQTDERPMARAPKNREHAVVVVNSIVVDGGEAELAAAPTSPLTRGKAEVGKDVPLSSIWNGTVRRWAVAPPPKLLRAFISSILTICITGYNLSQPVAVNAVLCVPRWVGGCCAVGGRGPGTVSGRHRAPPT